MWARDRSRRQRRGRFALLLLSLAVLFTVGPPGAAAATATDAPAAATTPAWSAPETFAAVRGGSPMAQCPTPTFCMIVDAAGHAVVYVNKKRQAAVAVDTRPLSALACSSPSFCLAADGDGDIFRFNGHAWAASTRVAHVGNTTGPSVSCSSHQFCIATFDRYAYRWNGARWSAAKSIVARGHGLTSVSCRGRNFCMAVEYGAGEVKGALRYDGHSWHRAATGFRYGNAIRSVSCSSPTFCSVVGEGDVTGTYNGHAWTMRPRVAGVIGDREYSRDLYSVSCRTHRFCVAVGSDGLAVTWRGSDWAKTPAPGYGRTLYSVSCPSTRYCLTVDPLGYRVRFNGTRWAAAVLIDRTTAPVETLACASTKACFAADEAGNVISYNGTRWGPAVVVDKYADPSLESTPALSCGSRFCLLVDWRGYTMRWNGTAWASTARSPFRYSPNVSCVRSTWCLSIGRSESYVQYSVFHGSSWSKPVNFARPTSGVGYGPPSCATTTFCMTSVDGAKYSVFDGRAWSKPRVIGSINPTTDAADSIICTAARQCVAQTFSGPTWVYDSAWMKRFAPPNGRRVGAVDCPSITSCVGSDAVGAGIRFDGRSWTTTSRAVFPTAAPSTYVPVTAVACASASSCFATDGTRVSATS